MIRTLVPAPYIRRYAHQSDITTERRSPALPTPHRPHHQRPCRVHLEPCRPSAGPTPLAPARPSAPSVSPSRASRRSVRPHLGQEPPGGAPGSGGTPCVRAARRVRRFTSRISLGDEVARIVVQLQAVLGRPPSGNRGWWQQT